jgi:hypothetical protein
MSENILHPRIIENQEWAAILFILAFAIIALTKSVFENRYADFIKLLFSDKYTKVYRDSIHLKSGFTISLFLVQIISFAFFIQLTMSHFGYASKTDWIQFIQITNFLVFFILSKFLIEKIIATAFNMDEFVDQFILQKITYRCYIGLFILPINLFIFYNDVISRTVLIIIIGLILIINVLTYLISIKNYQNLIFSKMFYFILYLCALEIAPYYFMYYWFTKGIA